MSIRIVNDSSRDILKGLYDPKDPVGFRVSLGKIIRANVIKTSNEYLSRNLLLTMDKNNAIIFPEVIMEAGESFVIKMLVLHASKDTPIIMPTGHIAGMKAILIRELYRQGEVLPFWNRVLSGSIWIQAVRLIIYFVFVIAILLAIIIPSYMISEKFDQLKRKKNVREFKANTSLHLNDSDNFIFSTYVKHDKRQLTSIQDLVVDQNTLDRNFNIYRKRFQKRYHSSIYGSHTYIIPLIVSCIDAGFIKDQDKSATVDSHMKETLDHFILFLKQQDPKSSDDENIKQIAESRTYRLEIGNKNDEH